MFNGKWMLILGLMVASVLAGWRNYRDPRVAEKDRSPIKLGLDLRGGIHLVVGVETDDALRAELDDTIKSAAAQAQKVQALPGEPLKLAF